MGRDDLDLFTKFLFCFLKDLLTHIHDFWSQIWKVIIVTLKQEVQQRKLPVFVWRKVRFLAFLLSCGNVTLISPQCFNFLSYFFFSIHLLFILNLFLFVYSNKLFFNFVMNSAVFKFALPSIQIFVLHRSYDFFIWLLSFLTHYFNWMDLKLFHQLLFVNMFKEYCHCSEYSQSQKSEI